MVKEKKPWKETGLSKFLDKAGKVVPGIAVGIGDALLDGKVSDFLDSVGVKLKDAEPSPELEKLRMEFEIERLSFEKEMASLEVQMFSMEIDDRKNSRQREIDILKAGGKNWTQHILAFVVVGAFLWMLYMLITGKASDHSNLREVLLLLLGALAAQFEKILSYFFGSSAGSAAKNKYLANKPTDI